jgi:hypothetical protein
METGKGGKGIAIYSTVLNWQGMSLAQGAMEQARCTKQCDTGLLLPAGNLAHQPM